MGDFYGKNAVKSEEFEEEDVWGMMSAREGSKTASTGAYSSSSSSSAWRVRATPRSIPQQSNKSKNSLWVCDDGVNIDDEEEMAPPHEYLATRLARSQIASHSMCEGVGRTLKGRDLSKLRNTILTKTGFLE